MLPATSSSRSTLRSADVARLTGGITASDLETTAWAKAQEYFAGTLRSPPLLGDCFEFGDALQVFGTAGRSLEMD